MRFLLENPLILVILIGVISSFFKKSKEAQAEREKRSPRKPMETQDTPLPVGTNRPVRGQKLNQQQPLRPQQNEHGRKAPIARRNTEVDEIDQYSAPPEEALHKNNIKQAAVAHDRARRQQSEEFTSITKKTLNTDPQTFIDGLIWSEVLGPPRAKKPHRAIK